MYLPFFMGLFSMNDEQAQGRQRALKKFPLRFPAHRKLKKLFSLFDTTQSFIFEATQTAKTCSASLWARSQLSSQVGPIEKRTERDTKQNDFLKHLQADVSCHEQRRKAIFDLWSSGKAQFRIDLSIFGIRKERRPRAKKGRAQYFWGAIRPNVYSRNQGDTDVILVMRKAVFFSFVYVLLYFSSLQFVFEFRRNRTQVETKIRCRSDQNHYIFDSIEYEIYNRSRCDLQSMYPKK